MTGLHESQRQYQAPGHVDALDGLRALAAAAVVWYHAGHTTGYFGRSVGVTTFFILSGFLITRVLLREKDRTGTIACGRFWARRALRTFPLYYAVLALYAVLVALLERGSTSGERFWRDLPFYLTFTSNLLPRTLPGERIIFDFGWSLALQEQFYLLWPFVLKHVPHRYAVALPLAFLLSSDIARWTGASAHFHDGMILRVVSSLDSPIFYGVVAAILLQTRQGYRVASRLAGRAWSIPVALAFVLLPALVPWLPQELTNVAFTLLVIACVLAPPPALKAIAASWLIRIGMVSYGIYLLHMLCLNTVRRVIPQAGPFVGFVLGFPLAVLLAFASRRWVEAPFLRVRDHWFPSLSERPSGLHGAIAPRTPAR